MTQTELNEIRETHIVPLENIIAALEAENARVRAELADIRPPWHDAPEWAEAVEAQWIWTGNEYMQPQNARYVIQYREEAEVWQKS